MRAGQGSRETGEEVRPGKQARNQGCSGWCNGRDDGQRAGMRMRGMLGVEDPVLEELLN